MPKVNEHLTDLDYEILYYVNNFKSVSKSDIIKHFSKRNPHAVEQRLKFLSTPEYSEPNYIHMSAPKSASSYLHEVRGSYSITPLGLMVLEDYTYERRKLHREKRVEFIWRFLTVFAAVLAALGALGGWRYEILAFLRLIGLL